MGPSGSELRKHFVCRRLRFLRAAREKIHLRAALGRWGTYEEGGSDSSFAFLFCSREIPICRVSDKAHYFFAICASASTFRRIAGNKPSDIDD
jgi:hypothetical protein